MVFSGRLPAYSHGGAPAGTLRHALVRVVPIDVQSTVYRSIARSGRSRWRTQSTRATRHHPEGYVPVASGLRLAVHGSRVGQRRLNRSSSGPLSDAVLSLPRRPSRCPKPVVFNTCHDRLYGDLSYGEREKKPAGWLGGDNSARHLHPKRGSQRRVPTKGSGFSRTS